MMAQQMKPLKFVQSMVKKLKRFALKTRALLPV